MAASFDGLADDSFAVTTAIGLGCVQEIDAEIESSMDGTDGFAIINFSPPPLLTIRHLKRSTYCIAAQPQGADLNIAFTKSSSEHLLNFPFCGKQQRKDARASI